MAGDTSFESAARPPLERLETLRALRAEGLITQAEYDLKAGEITRQLLASSTATPIQPRRYPGAIDTLRESLDRSWRWYLKLRRRWQIAIATGVVIVLLAIASSIGGGNNAAQTSQQQAAAPKFGVVADSATPSGTFTPTQTVGPTDTPGPTETPAPTYTPVPTNTPVPPPTPTPTFDQVAAAAERVSYENLFRYNERYVGHIVYFEGEVIQVIGGPNSYELRINVTQDQYGLWSDTVYADYTGSPRLLENDVIAFVGSVVGLKTYTGLLLQDVTLPWIKIQETHLIRHD